MESTSTSPEFITPAEFSEQFRVPLSTVRKWIRQGTGPKAYRVGPRHLRFRTAEVESWLTSQAVEGVDKPAA